MQGTCFKIRWFVCSRYLQRIPAPADLQMKRATVVAKGKSCSESVSRYYRKTSTQFWEQGYVYRGKQGGKTTYIASFETHVSVGGGGGEGTLTALRLSQNGDDTKILFYFDFNYFVSSSTASYSPHYSPLLYLS